MSRRSSIVALLVLMGCSSPPEPVETAPVAATTSNPGRPKPPSDYVGSESCRECHAEIATEYATHPMSRSLMPTATANIGEDFTDKVMFSPGYGVEYIVEKLPDGHVLHRERQVNPAGDELYNQAEEVAFTLGSGARESRYILNKSGQLFLSPISWYSQERKWGLSSGYEMPDHARFEGRVTDACVSCHSGKVDKPEDARDVFTAEPFRECAIGCERCHGPGGGHLQFQRKELAGESDPITKLAQLDAERRDAVCFQCHLQGEMRVARSDYDDFDFRPGMLFSDVWLAFLSPNEVADGGLSKVSHAEQMLSSGCYAGSQGAFGCISCHDPHRVPSTEEKIGFYRNKCIACHEGASRKPCSVPVEERKQTSAEDSCIVCHMPPIDAPQVTHATRTDHRVIRKPGAASNGAQPTKSESPREIFGRLFVESKAEVPADEVERAWAVFLGELAFESQNSDQATLAVTAAEKLSNRDRGDRVLATSLGKAYEVLQQDDSARAVWKDALDVWDHDEYLLERMGLSLKRANLRNDSTEYFTRLAQVNAFRPMYLEEKARLLASRGSTGEAHQAALEALKLNPSLVSINVWLGEVYGVMGRNELAAEHRRQAMKVKAAREALAPEGAKSQTPPTDDSDPTKK
jgi:Flp pilus assembly protein TadD